MNNCRNTDVIKYLVGNKCDLDLERRVSFDELQEKAMELNIRGFETSALPDKKSTIEDLFSELIKELVHIKLQKNLKLR